MLSQIEQGNVACVNELTLSLALFHAGAVSQIPTPTDEKC